MKDPKAFLKYASDLLSPQFRFLSCSLAREGYFWAILYDSKAKACIVRKIGQHDWETYDWKSRDDFGEILRAYV